MLSEVGLRKCQGKRALSGPRGREMMIKLCRYKANLKAAYEGILEYLDECQREEVKRGIENQEVNYPY